MGPRTMTGIDKEAVKKLMREFLIKHGWQQGQDHKVMNALPHLWNLLVDSHLIDSAIKRGFQYKDFSRSARTTKMMSDLGFRGQGY